MKINKIFFTLFTVIVVSTIELIAQTQRLEVKKLNIAVMDFEPREGITRGEAASLSDVFSAQLIETKEFTVVDRNRIKSILTEQGFQQSEACSQVECVVEAGKILKVQKMFAGVVGKLGRIYNINIQVIDISTAQIESNKSYMHDGCIEELAQEIIPKLALQFIEQLSGKGDIQSEASSLFRESNRKAPNQFSVFGGVAVPLGDFAKAITDQNIIEYINAQNLDTEIPFPFSGSAKIGFTIGAQFITSGTIGWIINSSYSQNKMVLPSEVVVSGYTYTLETASWHTFLALTGVKIGTSNSNGINFFASPLIGVLYGKSPEVSVKFSLTNNGITAKFSETYSSASNIGLAYGLSAQLSIGSNFVVGTQYVFCAQKYNIEDHYMLGIYPPSSSFDNIDRIKKVEKKLNTSILVGYIGFAF